MGFKKGRTFSIKLICAAGVVLITGLAAGASLVNLPVSFVSHLFIVKEEAELANSVNPSENKSQVTSNSSPIPIEVLPQHPWVDSVLNTLTLEEKIGQLFMVSAYSNRKESEYREMENLIRRYNVGGILFFQGGPERQAALTNRYQAVAKVPMLIGLDAEWGLGMRLDSTISYPRQLTLGGISDNQLIYEMGYEIGRQLRRIGVNVNFAPVADINSNPRNPVIGNRSFGDDKV
ncbi:MAG: glycoside hydrolase family 3 N-terminal domain-containing protein, partial [Spirosomataceae bacterium]